MTRLTSAIERLETMNAFVRLMQLFRRNCPSAFRREVAARGVTPFAGGDEIVRSIDAFLDALDSRFPVSAWSGDWIYQQILEGATVPYLPVLTQSLEDECESGAANLRLGYRVILAATRDSLGDLMMRPLVGAPLGQYPELAQVAKLCASKRGRICLLADAYRYVVGETGSFLLDVCEEMCAQGEPVDFDQNAIDFLTADWKHGRAILARCARFNDWIEADLSRIKPVVAILRAAVRPERVRVRVMTNGQATNRPLIETLDDYLDEDDDYAEEEFEVAA